MFESACCLDGGALDSPSLALAMEIGSLSLFLHAIQEKAPRPPIYTAMEEEGWLKLRKVKELPLEVRWGVSPLRLEELAY